MLLILFLFSFKAQLVSPVVSFEDKHPVLGLFTTTPNIFPTQNYITYDIPNKVIPSVTKTAKKEKKKSKSNSHNNSDNSETDEQPLPTIFPTLTPTPTDLINLNEKLTLISNYTKAQSTTPTLDELTLKSIFEHQIIDTFGVDEVNKVFTNVKNIYFTNINVQGGEATAVAVVEYSTIMKIFTCYFVKQSDVWYLYKTENL